MQMSRNELFILSRFTYRVGEPIISDSDYDLIEKQIKEEGILNEYTSRTYDDDPIPYDLLQKYNMNYLVSDAKSLSKYSKYLDTTKSLSIQAVTEMRDVYQFVRDHLNQAQDECSFNLSLKMDGVNAKALYVNGKLELCVSRGRGGNSIDYTKCAMNCLPHEIDTDAEYVIIYTEAFVLEDYLEYFRTKYQKEYKTPKSAAITMLRVQHDLEDYKYLNMIGIDVDGIDFKTKEEKYEFLDKIGFSYAPNCHLNQEFIDCEYPEFESRMNGLTNDFDKEVGFLPSDGLVLEVSEQSEDFKITNQYSSKNIALKLNEWSFSTYDAIVTDIVVEQQRVNASVRIKIEKIRTDDLCEAEWVNGYNPDIIMSQGINIGSKIKFERNSGAINCLVYK